MTPAPPRLLYVVNHLKFFFSHRLPLARAARHAGYEVHVAAPRMGFTVPPEERWLMHHDIPIGRGLDSLAADFRTIGRLAELCRAHAFTLVHAFTHKPVLLTALARRRSGMPPVVYSLTGLGHLALGRGRLIALVRRLFFLLAASAFRRPRAEVTFQNEDDLLMFLERGCAIPGRSHLIRGTGIDIDEFHAVPDPPGPCLVMAPTRMLREKGVVEFADAAALVRRTHPEVRFVLVGDPDPGNPSSLPIDLLRRWVDEGRVEWWGHRHEMPATLAKAHIVCLPSYREGIPRVLMEAAACGKAIVATDVPGCREAVVDGLNGLRILPRSPEAIRNAVLSLVENPERRRAMGLASRRLAVERFDHALLSRQMLDVYRKVLHV